MRRDVCISSILTGVIFFVVLQLVPHPDRGGYWLIALIAGLSALVSSMITKSVLKS
jgi:hypothetical protein